jgi:hypothetical protein
MIAIMATLITIKGHKRKLILIRIAKLINSENLKEVKPRRVIIHLLVYMVSIWYVATRREKP